MNRRDALKFFGGSAGLSAAIPCVRSVEQLKVEPGDAIVLKYDTRLSFEQLEALRDNWLHIQEIRPQFKDMPLLILDDGADIQVLKKA